MKKFITYSPTRINKFILVFIELKEEEKESVISSYSSSSITAVAYHAEKCVEEWYRKQYGDVEPQNDWKESYYDFLVTPKHGKQITVTIKYKREFYPKQVRSSLKRLTYFWKESDIYKKHVVFVIDDLKNVFLSKSMDLEFNINKNTKVILGYIGPANSFVPVSEY